MSTTLTSTLNPNLNPDPHFALKPNTLQPEELFRASSPTSEGFVWGVLGSSSLGAGVCGFWGLGV